MNESPFVTHRSILVDGDYSAAGFLQNFAMAMYAGGRVSDGCKRLAESG